MHFAKQPSIQSEQLTTILNNLVQFTEDLIIISEDMNLYINDSLKTLSKAVSGIKKLDDLVECSLWKSIQKVIDTYPCSENEKN